MFAARNTMFGGGARYDADAQVYFDAVEAVSSISAANKTAVNNFIVGCKADGIWSAIKASCLLAGPDSLAGALVPLVGPAPTNYNFVDGDYDRVNGLKGDGTSKYLNSNRAGNADPQNNRHASVYVDVSTAVSQEAFLGDSYTDSGGRTQIVQDGVGKVFRCSDQYAYFVSRGYVGGFLGVARNGVATVGYRIGGITTNHTQASVSPVTKNILIFARPQSGTLRDVCESRIKAYTIGESLDLALLDARLTTYMASLT